MSAKLEAEIRELRETIRSCQPKSNLHKTKNGTSYSTIFVLICIIGFVIMLASSK